MITLLIIIIAVLILLIILMIRFGSFIIKTFAEVLALIFVVLSIGTISRTVRCIDTYQQADTQLNKMERTTQNRADLLPTYSLETAQQKNNKVVEQVRKQYYNQKAAVYNANDLTAKIASLKQANKAFNQLNNKLKNNKSNNLQHSLKKDSSLAKQYQYQAKQYSSTARSFNRILTWPITRSLANFWVPTANELPY